MTDFTRINDKAVYDRILAFDEPQPVMIADGTIPPRGYRGEVTPLNCVEFRENGDVVLRMVAKGAQSVEAVCGNMGFKAPKMTFADRGDGVFEYTYPYEERFRGIQILDFYVNDILITNPFLPVIWSSSGNRYRNYIEIPDPQTPYISVRDVPHGAVTREIFWSETMKAFESCVVYTPPNYQEGSDYPVLYLLHGAGENEVSWTHEGKAAYIMDNLLSEGKAVPFIIVMLNGKLRNPALGGNSTIESIITKDLRNFIESHYRVRTDKWNRAIAGLSMGSMQAVYIGLRNPHLFGSLGSFTFLRSDPYKTYEGSPELEACKDAAAFANNYKRFFRSVGGNENSKRDFLEDDAFLAQYGIDRLPSYHRHIYEGVGHDWNCWRRALHDFAQIIFK